MFTVEKNLIYNLIHKYIDTSLTFKCTVETDLLNGGSIWYSQIISVNINSMITRYIQSQAIRLCCTAYHSFLLQTLGFVACASGTCSSS